MPRPKCIRKVEFTPCAKEFTPKGVGKSQKVILYLDELEAYKLRHYDGLNQIEAAKRMEISASTYQRILYSGYEKICQMLVEGKKLEIDCYCEDKTKLNK